MSERIIATLAAFIIAVISAGGYAGIARMNQVRFHLYTFIGSWPWCYALAYVGMKLGDHWDSDPRFKAIFHRFHFGVELVLLAGILWFVASHWRNRIRAEEA